MIIGINGAKGAGKDTVGQHLVSKHGFVRVGFADALKESAAALFDIPVDFWQHAKNDDGVKIIIQSRWKNPSGGWNVDQTIGITAREFLQRYGTEAHRDIFGEDFWVKAAMDKILAFSDNLNVVITDMRFPNEFDALYQVGAQLWKVRRPELDAEVSGDGHASEQILDDEMFDVVFNNSGTIENLYGNVDEYLSGFLANSTA